MTIDINIVCRVAYGEQMMLNFFLLTDDNTYKTVSLGMSTHDGNTWTYRIEDVDKRQTPHIDYYFSVNNAGFERCREWMVICHRLDLNLMRGEHVTVNARWHDEPSSHACLYTSAYTNCIEPRQKPTLGRSVFSKTLRLIACAPQIRTGERLAVIISCSDAEGAVGERAHTMVEHNICEWQVDINATTLPTSLRYRFAAIDAEGTRVCEETAWRSLVPADIEASQVVAYEVETAVFSRQEQPLRGESIRLSTLNSPGSCGLGDFGTIGDHVSTMRQRGYNMLLLPPFNDTIATHTSADANPYSAISVFALHPILVDLRQLPTIVDDAERTHIESLRQSLGQNSCFDYTATLDLKQSWLRLVFLQDGDRVMHTAAFRHFFASNEWWLVPYAQYCYLRDAYGTANFRIWPNHNEWTEAERGQLQNPRTKAYKKLAFIYYTQFVLHEQLHHLHDICVNHGIVLRGDLTANINPSGCDLWHSGRNVDSDKWWQRIFKTAEHFYDACHVPHTILSRPDIAQSTNMLLEK